jgi:L-alanine-DL-glutamate epimerase-like enolase superfamily enzyme
MGDIKGLGETMKITALKTFVHTAGNTFVKVETDEGLYGIGEAGLKRRGRAIAEVVKGFEPDVVGADPSRIEHLWQTMFRGGFFPGGVIQSAAVSAVDIALWDLKGKALGVPVYELLGGLTREKVACYPHIGERDAIERLVANCVERQAEGWQFARWGMSDPTGDGNAFEPRRAVNYGIAQVKAVREACGEEFGICVDVHTRLDPAAAIEFCKAVEPYRPFFIEDPIRSESTQALRLIRQQTSVPIAVGEQWDSKWAFQQVIEEDLMDYCRVDLCIAGGITEAKKIAGWCETHYIHLAPHNPLGPVSTAACLHLCLSSPLVGVQELPRIPGTTLTDIFPKQVPYEAGHLLVPEGPGLGIEFNEEAFESVEPYVAGKGHYFLRDDGSYTNW